MNQVSRLLLPSKEPLRTRKMRVVIREAAIGAEAVIGPQRADVAGAGADIVTEAEILTISGHWTPRSGSIRIRMTERSLNDHDERVETVTDAVIVGTEMIAV
jgi:hypothetical protein